MSRVVASATGLLTFTACSRVRTSVLYSSTKGGGGEPWLIIISVGLLFYSRL